jgi:putative oxidoreductase
MDVGLLILRIVLGGFIAAHGIQKMTHLWGGGGLGAATREFRDDGFAGGAVTALMAGGTQIAAGLGVAIGLLTPIAAAGIIGVLTVAATVKVRVGFWSQDGGYEYPLFLALLADALVWTGPGRFSVDHAAGLSAHWNTWVSVVATVIGFGAALLLRAVLHRPPLVLIESERAA